MRARQRSDEEFKEGGENHRNRRGSRRFSFSTEGDDTITVCLISSYSPVSGNMQPECF